MRTMLFSGQPCGWKTLSQIIDIRMSNENPLRRQILPPLAHFSQQSDGFHAGQTVDSHPPPTLPPRLPAEPSDIHFPSA